MQHSKLTAAVASLLFAVAHTTPTAAKPPDPAPTLTFHHDGQDLTWIPSMEVFPFSTPVFDGNRIDGNASDDEPGIWYSPYTPEELGLSVPAIFGYNPGPHPENQGFPYKHKRATADRTCEDIDQYYWRGETTEASPQVKHCQVLHDNIVGNGTWSVYKGTQRTIATHASCAVGIEALYFNGPRVYWNYIGNENVREIVSASFDRIGWGDPPFAQSGYQWLPQVSTMELRQVGPLSHRRLVPKLPVNPTHSGQETVSSFGRGIKQYGAAVS
ncbi:putative necrosis-inducing factor-domain-containing protein [Podospora australis]|uniref:Necrosis-inducing factor-domain-containing protein n=1 Tax=Podospora australis TaxID=1536484 RepID=A0AAN6WLT0_9PEZI|nr:putative necrosis-inducing factor-domain-containing protein [Podospora australis]